MGQAMGRLGSALALGAVVVLSACSSAVEEAPPPPPPTVVAPTATQPAVVATGDAVLEGDRIKIARPIFYDTDKDIIRPESFPVLDAVANVVINHPEIKALLVEGHTDNQGSFDHNRKLSEKRANAVVTYLAQRGVRTPIRSVGYGATAQQCFTPDDACLQINRRVEFRVER